MGNLSRLFENFDNMDMLLNTNDHFDYDIIKDDNKININFYLAGFKKDDIEISNKKNYLIIKTKKIIDNNTNYIRKSKYHGEKTITFDVSDSYDLDNVNAKYDNGVLSLELKEKERKKIEIL